MRPSEAEKKDPALFAARVQRAMADALGVPVTEHSFADTRLLFAARKLKLPLAPTVLAALMQPLGGPTGRGAMGGLPQPHRLDDDDDGSVA